MSFFLTTPRLRLTPFSEKDLAAFHALNAEPFVRKYLWDDEMISLEMARELLQQNAQCFAERGWGLWQIQFHEEPAVLGYAGLWFFFDEPQPQLLYALREPHTGQGLATEAAARVRDYALAELGFSYLLAATDAGHEASAKVARRLGMEKVAEKVVDGKLTWFFRLEKHAPTGS